MTRLPRTEILDKSKYFHILTCGLVRENVFKEDNLKRFYVNAMAEKAADMGVSVLAYVVMDNHSHLMVTAEDANVVPEFMRRLNTTYAKFFNRIKNRSGYVFKGRYDSEPLLTAEQVESCITFVHNNPCAAGVELFSADYPFSSAKSYMFGEGIADIEAVKKLFGEVPELTSYQKEKYDFLEQKPNEDCDTVLMELIQKFRITDKYALQDPEILKAAIYELQSRCGVSLRDVAVLLGIDREKIRRTALKMKEQKAL